ncbi:type VII secretion protein EccB [Actinoplanes sp. CA-030573]|uniref:type VII secretion protein EccB n=1 Tax=Actinoplanes sp. CA-030573 TaxID=3239898 RepID=UPI003D8E1E0C
MPSRQDQLHSYQYSLQRVVAALVSHDPDPARSPLRRAGTTALVSLLIASLAVGAAAIYGLLTGHSNVEPKDPKVVFQEKGTGARYVYLESDAKLHPVLNYTSGLLLANAEAPELKGISAEKLATVPQGAPLGIPDAPDSLPAKAALITGRWSVCTDNQGEEDTPRSTLLVGDKLTDGAVAARTGEALLIREPEGRTAVVYNNRRFSIPGDRLTATLRVLGWAGKDPWPVSTAWANAVPLARNLVAPKIPEVGSPSQVSGFRVGDLVTDSGKGFAVIMPDGAADLTEVQAKLMQAVPGVEAPRAIGNEFIQLPASKTRISDAGAPDGLPVTVPKLHDTAPGRVCMTLPIDDKAGDGIRIDPTVPTGVEVESSASDNGVALADLVHIPRGKGVLAVQASSPTAPADSGTVSVVTDTGRNFPLASRAIISKLGYGGVKPVQIPSELVAMLPRGPALDPARARQTDVQ